ncbi:hypothetical protein Trydic_g12570, partial [Trypoxylus dichotomus]
TGNHLPSQQCSFKITTKAQTINPYKELEKGRSFKSACLKCAACLVVAENINKIFMDIYYKELSDGQQQRANYLCQILRRLCSTGFKNYDLREFDGNRLITKSSTSNTHVNSEMNGKWTKILRSLCKIYIHHLPINHILQKYKIGTINITEHICNGDGIFRDCGNLNVKQRETIHTEIDLNSKGNITCI